ncbi:MAG: DUF1449 family protein [Roseivirga sp.]|nr:DUF1449 family protein [Roseivirga sp.]
MKELLELSFQGANAIPSFLLIFVLIYWVVVMFGAVDMDFFDIDVDVDVDGPEVDADADISVGWLNSVLIFFNLPHIPLMIFVSFLALPMWLISVQLNELIGNTNLLLGIVFLIPNLLVSLFVAKFLTMPFVKLFSKMNAEGETTTTMIGKICHVILTLNSDSVGQVEVNVDGSNYRINAKTTEDRVMKKGEEGLVIEYHEDGKYYVVEPYTH